MISDDYPTVTITGGNSKSIDYEEDLTIEGSAAYDCPSAGIGKTLTPTWTQTDGLNLGDLSTYETTDYQLDFPACTLQAGQNYGFDLTVDIAPDGTFVNVEVSVDVAPESFTVDITGGDTTYSAAEPEIDFEAELTYDHSCDPAEADIEYIWSCEV
mmetsp:Transcript_30579/g.27780  ORF Transcript_30579/g.27780 Transcript_30579/m.27780 type:complete len:156 (+) Transcript_30579:470-937(+)